MKTKTHSLKTTTNIDTSAKQEQKKAEFSLSPLRKWGVIVIVMTMLVHVKYCRDRKKLSANHFYLSMLSASGLVQNFSIQVH